jgi:hypothetical protein
LQIEAVASAGGEAHLAQAMTQALDQCWLLWIRERLDRLHLAGLRDWYGEMLPRLTAAGPVLESAEHLGGVAFGLHIGEHALDLAVLDDEGGTQDAFAAVLAQTPRAELTCDLVPHVG